MISDERPWPPHPPQSYTVYYVPYARERRQKVLTTPCEADAMATFRGRLPAYRGGCLYVTDDRGIVLAMAAADGPGGVLVEQAGRLH
jgi:hypothetical protein